jgi:ribosomal protein L12E/L44/L45/RPP1/RPP2
MKKLITGAAAACLLLVACGGVDREGTRDELVEQLESAGITADEDCIDSALDEYSDDELKEIDEALGEGDQSGEAGVLLTKILECVETP